MRVPSIATLPEATLRRAGSELGLISQRTPRDPHSVVQFWFDFRCHTPWQWNYSQIQCGRCLRFQTLNRAVVLGFPLALPHQLSFMTEASVFDTGSCSSRTGTCRRMLAPVRCLDVCNGRQACRALDSALRFNTVLEGMVTRYSPLPNSRRVRYPPSVVGQN